MSYCFVGSWPDFAAVKVNWVNLGSPLNLQNGPNVVDFELEDYMSTCLHDFLSGPHRSRLSSYTGQVRSFHEQKTFGLRN